MRKALFALVAALGLMLAFPVAAQADEPVVVTAEIVDTPDNDCPVWARDTFTRTTTLTDDDADGDYDVRFDSTGTFVATSGITGTLTEVIEYQVTGVLLDAEALDALDGETVDMSGVACKSDSPDADKTSQFALRYFEAGATATSISSWSYTYDTGCESFTETTGTEAVGADTFAGIGCPGQDGADGEDGSDGSDGQDGNDGEDGADGSDGQDGADGQDGTDDNGGTTTVKDTTKPASTQETLPDTGVSPLLLVGGGIVLVLAGGGLFAARRRTQ